MAYRNPRSVMYPHRLALRMPRGCLGLLAYVLARVSLATPADAPIAEGEADGADIAFHCAPERSSVILADQPQHPRRGYEARVVDLGSLVVYGKADSRGEVLRVGTKALTSECGALTVVIRGAYYNANPQGELGAAEDYAVVTIRQQDRVLLGPIALGTCSKGTPRYDIHAKCPEEWATHVEMHAGQNGAYSVQLQHDYYEWMTVTP